VRTALRPAVLASVVFFVLCGLAYPLAETGLGAAFFSHQAGGSLTANGSTLIGQKWEAPMWFQGRPDSDDPTATGGSNLAATSKKLETTVAQRIAAWHKLGVDPTEDLVTQSGSGVDPDISPAGAYAQVQMVADARHLPVSEVRQLVQAHVHGAQLGFLGAPYVNVGELDQALADLRRGP
jgi:K+-transporting ATPase ATPase C chain